MPISFSGSPALASSDAVGFGQPISTWGGSSFSILGNTTGAQVFWAILNDPKSGRIVVVDLLDMIVDMTAVLTVFGGLIGVHPGQAVTGGGALGGGSAMTKILADSARPSVALITMLQATASDGGAATAITGGAFGPPSPYYRVRVNNMHTLVGQRLCLPVPLVTPYRPLVVRPNEGVLCAYQSNGAANPATNAYSFNVHAREYAA
jgi:hypothetical protein